MAPIYEASQGDINMTRRYYFQYDFRSEVCNWTRTFSGTWNLTPRGNVLLHFSAINGAYFLIDDSILRVGKRFDIVRKKVVLPLMSQLLGNRISCHEEHLAITKLSDSQMSLKDEMMKSASSKALTKKRMKKIRKGALRDGLRELEFTS